MMPGWLTFAQAASFPALAVAGLVLAIVAAIRVWPKLRELQLAEDSSLRSVLMARVGELETRVADLEKLLSKKEAIHAAELGDLSHDLANETACLEAFMLLVETSPDRVLEHIPKIKEMRREHRERVALRRGAREGAAVNAAQGGPV